ncbi:hypothetical protein VTI28DRAFT_2553 [Corynascus sepedonium]
MSRDPRRSASRRKPLLISLRIGPLLGVNPKRRICSKRVPVLKKGDSRRCRLCFRRERLLTASLGLLRLEGKIIAKPPCPGPRIVTETEILFVPLSFLVAMAPSMMQYPSNDKRCAVNSAPSWRSGHYWHGSSHSPKLISAVGKGQRSPTG